MIILDFEPLFWVMVSVGVASIVIGSIAYKIECIVGDREWKKHNENPTPLNEKTFLNNKRISKGNR